MKKAFITGVTGQDGSYLAELLLSKGYEVHGMARRSSSPNAARIAHILGDQTDSEARFFMHYGDLGESSRLVELMESIFPDEVYNLAAQSDVGVSFEGPEYTGDTTALGTLRLLEAIRRVGSPTKFYQASSSEMFGASPPPQDEATPFYPRSPYAAAKVYSYWMTKNYRESYGMFAANGILFNHESPRRGESFVTRKITHAVARILKGTQKELRLGNLEAVRDWGYAPEYVDAMWRILQADAPDDFVVATGTKYSIRDFLSFAFGHVGLNWEDYVRVDSRFIRPAEVDALVGDSSKMMATTGWRASVLAPELAQIMVKADMEFLAAENKPWIDNPFNA